MYANSLKYLFMKFNNWERKDNFKCVYSTRHCIWRSCM